MTSEAFEKRTQQLFLLLSSSHDGEVAAAARALLRHLDNAGIDVHGAARALALASLAGAEAISGRDVRVLAQRLLAAGELQSRETEFLESLSRRRRPITTKQEKWLRDIQVRLAGEQASGGALQ